MDSSTDRMESASDATDKSLQPDPTAGGPASQPPRTRWYPSTYVVGGLILVVLFLANLPGHVVLVPSPYYFPGAERVWPLLVPAEIAHGWPWTFLQRDLHADALLCISGRRDVTVDLQKAPLWAFFQDVRGFSLLCLFGDAAVGATVLAIGTWLCQRWRRQRAHWFQFHLRELLAAVAMASFAMGCLRLEIQERLCEQSALRHLTSSGCLIEPAGPHWLRQLVGDRWFEFFDRVADIALRHPSERLELLPQLHHLRALQCESMDTTRYVARPERLEILDCEAAREQLVQLRRFPNLRALTLIGGYSGRRWAIYSRELGVMTRCHGEWTRRPELAETSFLTRLHLDDEGASHLASLTKIEALSLVHVSIRDSALLHLSRLRRLQHLAITDPPISDTHLKYLGRMQQLTLLDLQNTRITDAGLKHLQGLTRLEGLLLGNTRVSGAGLAHLQGLPHLRSLELWGTEIADAQLEHLKGLDMLEVLNLDRTRITDAGLARLTAFSRLQDLSLNHTNLTDSGLKYLGGSSQFRRLSFRGTQVTDAGLELLKGMSQLQALDLAETQTTPAGIRAIRQSLPNCTICVY